MSTNLAYLENRFMTPGYPKEKGYWQGAIRTFEQHVRDGLLEAPRFSHYNRFEYDLATRQKTEVLLGVLFMVGLPAKIEGDHFEDYAAVLWQVVYSVPKTALDGIQFEKYRFWTKRQQQLLAREQASYNIWKGYHGSW